MDILGSVNKEANPELLRMTLKLATGAGKASVMAMLIAWQTINADTVVLVVEMPDIDAVDLASNFDEVRVGQGNDFTIGADNASTKYIITGLPTRVGWMLPRGAFSVSLRRQRSSKG